MNSRVSMMKSIVVAIALVAGVSGIARADDSSMNPFTGDSYAYFNGGNLGHITNPPVYAKGPSPWRQANPNGLSESEIQAESSSSVASAFQPQVSAFDKAPSAWRQSHPNGLSDRDYQALSSEAPAWHSSPRSAPSALASTPDAAVVTGAAE